MSDADKANEIVAHVCNIFTEVPIEHIYGLIPSICSIEMDDVNTATLKICNFLIENGDMFDNPDLVIVNKIATSNVTHTPPRNVIELVDSDFSDNDGGEPNLMDLAHQLAGTARPNVPQATTFDNRENDKMLDKIETQPKDDTHLLIDEINEPTRGDSKPKKTNELKKFSDTEVLSDVGVIVQDVKIIVNTQETACVDVNLDNINASSNVQQPTKRRKKESTIVNAELDFTGIGTNIEIVTTKPPVVIEDNSAAGEPMQGADSSSASSEPPIVSSVPNLDSTVTDVDVLFECGCCFNENPFDYMVQCLDGHLFCCQCLERYAQESVYGHGKGELLCMTAGCSEIFPNSQLYRALPFSLYKKYEERVSDECLNSAGLENFVRCKFCGYGAELEPEQQFFTCTQCEKRFCRKCEELFQDHEGLRCEEVEKDGETKIRTDYEEKMAEAKIRTCSKCKSRFTKESGCNKITCRCSQTMCYICRTEKIDYTHFCQHPRSPNKDCKSCKACFLWSNADEDDKLAIEEIQKEAFKVREKEGYQTPRHIGAPNEREVAVAWPNKTTAPRRRRGRVANRVRDNARLPNPIADQEVERAAQIRHDQLMNLAQRPLIQPARLPPPIPGMGKIIQLPPPLPLPPPNMMLFPPPQIDIPPPAVVRSAPASGQAINGAQAQVPAHVPEVAVSCKPKRVSKVVTGKTREDLILTAGISLVQRAATPPQNKTIKQGKVTATATREMIVLNSSRSGTTSLMTVPTIVNDPRLSRIRLSTNGFFAEPSVTNTRDTKNKILEQVHTIEDALEYKNFDQIKWALNVLKNIANDL